jgi:hypothetical protein
VPSQPTPARPRRCWASRASCATTTPGPRS